MKRRQDSDIFGAKSAPVAPRIQNDTYVDPNAAFNRKMEEQYDNYRKQVQNNQFRMTARTDFSQVNENADFDQQYHRSRKDQDMQSSIFYEPTVSASRVSYASSQAKIASNQNQYDPHRNFGRKETLNRQLNQLPENHSEFRGNSSRLFGFDQRVEQDDHKHHVNPLIPYYMKWEDYDSVRYEGNLKKTKPEGNFVEMDNISQSNSTVFVGKRPQKNNPEQNNQQSRQGAFTKKSSQNPTLAKKSPAQPVKKQNTQKQVNKESKLVEQVQVKILNGWSSKHLEGLTKQCKINGTPIIKFEQNDGGKGLIVLKKTKRWEVITDWLRKDAKLKIRVLNP